MKLSVYLDLVADSLLTEILLQKNSEFRRFGPFWRPRFRRRFFREIDEILAFLTSKTLEFHQFHVKFDALIYANLE